MYFILFKLSLPSVLVGLILLYEPASRVLIIGPFQNDKVTLFSFPISVLLNSECWQGSKISHWDRFAIIFKQSGDILVL